MVYRLRSHRKEIMRKKGKGFNCMLAVVLASALLAGCGVNVVNKDDGLAVTEPSKTASGGTVATKEGEKVTLKVVDWSDSTKERREAFNKKFMEENPNVTVEYTVLTVDQFKETVISAIKAGNAPDLFPIPSGMKLSSAVDENWYTPINDYVTEDFFNTFGAGALNEGITTLDGKVYVLPEAANIINTLIFYNKNVLKEAGISEDNLPKTWSELRDVCKQITKAGNGKYYGMIDSGAQSNRLELVLRSLASTAGARCSDISQIMLVNGENTLDSPAMVKAFDFYDTLVKDGSIHPDTVTLKAPEARALFAQNQAAFIPQGAWCISTWRKDNPDLDFGVMAMPVPDDGQTGKLPYVGAQPWMGISANCAHPDVAAKYLMGLYSDDYQSSLVSDGGFVSVIDSVNQKAMTDPVMKKYYELNQEVAALAPDPIVAKPETAQVYAQASSITPGLGEIAQGVLAQSVDYRTELQTLAKNTQTEWMKAIDAVKASGKDVSASDFEFKNWDPMKNYTAQMYKDR